MSKEKQIEERVELSDIIDYAMRDWDHYIDECREEEIPPIDTFEEWIADAVLRNGYRKQEWISIDERLPELNTNVLIYVFFHNQWQIVKGWHSYCDKKFHIANSDYPSLTDIPVTHWMPLPEAPKMKGGGE